MTHASLNFLVLGTVLMAGCPVGKSLGDPSQGNTTGPGSTTDDSSGTTAAGESTDSSAGASSTTGGASETCGTACSGEEGSGTQGSETGGEPNVCGGFGPPSGPCTDEPPCPFGDFCAGGQYECIDGGWKLRITHGCGAEVVECEDGPEMLNGCDTDETCDPGGDCLDVLECEGSNWVERAQCSSITCPAANPTHGQACVDPDVEASPFVGWHCTLDHSCGVQREYVCQSGYWAVDPDINEACLSAVACEDGPILGDACETEAEVCGYESPVLDALTCESGLWG
ncbi:MAG: hypothetical protein KUG77_19505 [Nannocystaceae bacterium]|nr:hypothetical protein [Nannocystaceae bacterium]